MIRYKQDWQFSTFKGRLVTESSQVILPTQKDKHERIRSPLPHDIGICNSQREME